MSLFDPEVLVPADKFAEMDKKLSTQSIVEGGKCQTFMWQNEEWVSTSAMSKGNNHGWHSIRAQRVQELISYKGELEPLKYRQHFDEVDKGNRRRSYEGMRVKQGSRELVFVELEVNFGQQVAKPIVAEDPDPRVGRHGQFKLFFA